MSSRSFPSFLTPTAALVAAVVASGCSAPGTGTAETGKTEASAASEAPGHAGPPPPAPR
jgi:hypothetical protein